MFALESKKFCFASPNSFVKSMSGIDGGDRGLFSIGGLDKRSYLLFVLNFSLLKKNLHWTLYNN